MSLLTNLSATVVQANQGYVNLPDPRPLYPSFTQTQGPTFTLNKLYYLACLRGSMVAKERTMFGRTPTSCLILNGRVVTVNVCLIAA